MKKYNCLLLLVAFVYLSLVCPKTSEAVVQVIRPGEIDAIKTAVPTPTPTTSTKFVRTPINLPSIEPLPTATPTKTLVIKTPLPKVTLRSTITNAITPTETVEPSPTTTPTLETKTPLVTVEPTDTATTATKDTSQDNLVLWFLGITIVLLLAIVAIQAMPKKNSD
jgi:hypothetical protein